MPPDSVKVCSFCDHCCGLPGLWNQLSYVVSMETSRIQNCRDCGRPVRVDWTRITGPKLADGTTTPPFDRGVCENDHEQPTEYSPF